ncbi:hypothetical protein DFH09DRAFT_1174882 [Mycena vulgaris]|nr:hypothetical protein DFH09DRAFT_1371138 [Mycena vulgaris]KAJ6540990.1 hypothetical protein DFH09DRAFT_1174882 [Mycena vulgaris]
MPARYIHIPFFYVLNTVATCAQTVLKRTNGRFRSHGEERRRSVASIFPIIVAKTALFALAFPVICAIVLGHESWDGALVTRSHLCAQPLMVAYLFDMTYRKVNAILWVHHTLTIGACLFFVLATTPDAPDAGRLWLSVPMVFLGVGVGVTDLGGDVAVLLYYLAPQSLSSARAIRMCARYLMAGRASQWFMVLSILFRGQWQQLALGPGSIAIIGAVLLGWGSAELEEIYAILGMSEKLRLRVLSSDNDGTAKL